MPGATAMVELCPLGEVGLVPPEERCSPVTQVVVATGIWWTAAVYVTLMFKLTLDTPGTALPPFALTGLVNASTGLLAFTASLFPGLQSKAPVPKMLWVEVGLVLWLGFIQGLELGLLNKSLETLTVSERSMMQNISVLLIMLVAWLFDLERLTFLRILAGVVLAVGGVIQGIDRAQSSTVIADEEAHSHGVVCMMGSLLCTSFKWSQIQWMTQESHDTRNRTALAQMTKLELTAYMQPVTGLVCLSLAALYEMPALSSGSLLHGGVLTRVLVIAAGITIIQVCELKLVQLTSAVATGVLITVHHVPMALAGVVFLHEQVDFLGIISFVICIMGGLIYAIARLTDAEASATYSTENEDSSGSRSPSSPCLGFRGSEQNIDA